MVSVLWRRIAPLGLRYYFLLTLMGWVGHVAMAALSIPDPHDEPVADADADHRLLAGAVIVVCIVYIFSAQPVPVGPSQCGDRDLVVRDGHDLHLSRGFCINRIIQLPGRAATRWISSSYTCVIRLVIFSQEYCLRIGSGLFAQSLAQFRL